MIQIQNVLGDEDKMQKNVGDEEKRPSPNLAKEIRKFTGKFRVRNKLAKARKTRKSLCTLSLKKFGPTIFVLIFSLIWIT